MSGTSSCEGTSNSKAPSLSIHICTTQPSSSGTVDRDPRKVFVWIPKTSPQGGATIFPHTVTSAIRDITERFNDLGWLDAGGHGHSEDLRVQERFTRRDFGHIDVGVTITDPKTFTKSFTINFVERLLPDTDVFEHICAEDEKGVAHTPK